MWLTRLVYAGDADSTAHSLGQRKLIVCLCQRRHHEPEDVEERPTDNERSRSIVVKYITNDGS